MKKIIIHDRAILTAVGHHTQRAFQSVVCVETGERFASMTDAAENRGVHPSAISAAAHDPGTRRCCKHRWVKASQIPEHADMLLEHTSALYAENTALKQAQASMDEELREFRAWKAEQERVRKERESRDAAIAKCAECVERRRRIATKKDEEAQHARARLHEAEQQLAVLQQ
ncbi:MAG: hypothetical protein IKZ17_01360 [Bacteroidaceae bacterium]|nr:hypothetical protein [Bacteroidaceae bacterium]